MTSRAAIRTARQRTLARLIREGLASRKTCLELVEIQARFRGDAAFPLLSQLHLFVSTQHVSAPHPGPGQGRRVIILNNLAKRYANEILGAAECEDFAGPEFGPIGDPIFTMSAARM
jgi:hypothetical protein